VTKIKWLRSKEIPTLTQIDNSMAFGISSLYGKEGHIYIM